MGDSAVGTLTRAVAVLMVFGLAGCSAPGARYSAGYAHPHRSHETAGSTTSAREQVADLGGGSRGVASFYSGRAATGERVGSNVLTAAHRTLPFGTKVRVTNLKNGQSVTVRINDRGPFIRNRSIDLSDGAAGVIGMKGAGIAPVRMEVIR
ncbi:MAG: septal ring lytic transglycosylase RlpA family protein [Alphaproteobacteria bacterium]|nr:MAG: septal ring lytic transglycosylase RlpA family protein [Alphaproteobacteria bacterium]